MPQTTLNWRLPIDRDEVSPMCHALSELVVVVGQARAQECVEFRRVVEDGAALGSIHVEAGPAAGTGEVLLVAQPSERLTAAVSALQAIVGQVDGVVHGHAEGSGSEAGRSE